MENLGNTIPIRAPNNGGNLAQSVAPNGTNKTTYQYDDADRLTRIERRGNTGQLLTVSEFGYDYASRRAFTREYDFANGGWANPQIKRRVFDGLDVVQERNANNEVTAQIVRDGNIGGILSRTTATGAAFYGYDGNGNVTLLTNSAGVDVGHYRYDAFGNTLEVWGARGVENPYRFSTKEWHAASGLVDYGFRFYSPGLGRWLNRDPIAENGGVNLYAMVGNNPINDVDDYGEVGLRDIKDAVANWVKDKFFGKPKVETISNEPGADDYAAAQNTSRLGSGILPRDSRVVTGKAGSVPGSRPINPANRRAGAINPKRKNSRKVKNPRKRDSSGNILPTGKRVTLPRKGDAKEAAKRRGNGNEPVLDPDQGHGPHYHPGDGKGGRHPKYGHDHYYWNKN